MDENNNNVYTDPTQEPQTTAMPEPEPTPAPEPEPVPGPEPNYSSDSAQGYVPSGYGKERNIALCIVFSFITCGIYGLYWLYCLNEEINSLSGDTNATSSIMVIVFSIITCNIYTWFWLYKMGERCDKIKEQMGKPGNSSPILYLIFGLFGLNVVSYALMQDTINEAVALQQ